MSMFVLFSSSLGVKKKTMLALVKVVNEILLYVQPS